MSIVKLSARQKIKFRIRKKIAGTAEVPRLTIFRSNKSIYAQLIDDKTGKVLLAVSSRSKDLEFKGPKLEQSTQVGAYLAEKAKAINIDKCKFDRNGYLYHGRVKAVAEGARSKGMQF